jgi:hypothetical protein
MSVDHCELLNEGVESFMLDDLVDGIKSEEASTINNDGVEAQAAFLESKGWDTESILNWCREEMK